MLSKCFKLKVVAEDESNTWALPEIEVTHDLEKVEIPVWFKYESAEVYDTEPYIVIKRCKNCHQLFWEKEDE